MFSTRQSGTEFHANFTGYTYSIKIFLSISRMLKTLECFSLHIIIYYYYILFNNDRPTIHALLYYYYGSTVVFLFVCFFTSKHHRGSSGYQQIAKFVDNLNYFSSSRSKTHHARDELIILNVFAVLYEQLLKKKFMN